MAVEDGHVKAFACLDCVDGKQLAFYCSEACAAAHISEHRDSKHGIKTGVEDMRSMLTPLTDIVETLLRRENPGLKFSSMG